MYNKEQAMDQCKMNLLRVFLTGLFTSFVTQASSDYLEGDSFQCKSELAVRVFQRPNQLTKMKPQEFTITIAQSSITFYSKSYLSSTAMDLRYLVNDSLAAGNEYSVFSLELGSFHYADAYSFGAALITGTCETL